MKGKWKRKQGDWCPYCDQAFVEVGKKCPVCHKINDYGSKNRISKPELMQKYLRNKLD